MLIDSLKWNDSILKTSVIWKKQHLSSKAIRSLIWKYPFVTLMIIMYIHRQALKLWIKKVKLYKKDDIDERIVMDMNNKIKETDQTTI
jgi:DUF1365 family protein